MGPAEWALIAARTVLENARIDRGANPSLEIDLAYLMMGLGERFVDDAKVSGRAKVRT